MKKRILVVDDEPGFTTLIKYGLEGVGGYEVNEENDPNRALATARQFDPEVVILDVMMPDVDGSDVAAALREDARFAQTPIIFMTALALGSDGSPGSSRRGGQTYLPKDTPLEALIECIEEKIKARKTATAQ
jgi:CheY-like chemotaxis protein